jgi:hypothetical protein
VRDERSFTLSLEVGPIDESASWAQWEALGVALARELPVRALTTLAHEVQQRLLARVCGPRWRPQRHLPAPFTCPREGCGATGDFARKGVRSRLRRLDTAVGTLRLRLANVACRGCGRVFAPLLVLLGIPANVRRTERLGWRLAELSTQMSFARTATVAGDLAAMPATAPRAHAALADVAGLLGALPPAEASPEVVLLDGTGARAGADRLGVGVHLAVGLIGRGGPLRRRRAHTVWLGATVAEPWSAMARQLAGVMPPALVLVDGEDTITALVGRLWPDTPIQRCWWHLPHGLIKAAYADPGRPHPAWARHLASLLGDLVGDAFAGDWDQADALAAYDDLAAAVPARYTAMTAYLTAARPHVFTFLDDRLQRRLAHLGGVDLGTGVLERVMRELNARTDIGGTRWSIAGLRDLITVKTAQMLSHPVYQHLRKEILLPNTIGFDLHCKKVNG